MRPLLVNPGSSVFVDGFPRSANSYAFYAFRHLLGSSRVQGHTHSADQVRRAAHAGVPTILLIRDPQLVLPSLVQYVPGLPFEAAAAAYARFYQAVRPVAGACVVAPFETVTTNLPAVLRAANTKYGTDFPTDALDPTDDAAIIDLVRTANEHHNAGNNSRLALPSNTRRPAQEVVRSLGRSGVAALGVAERTYENVLSWTST